jgi:hypothetical protein
VKDEKITGVDELGKYVWGKVFAFYERGELSSAKQFTVETKA